MAADTITIHGLAEAADALRNLGRRDVKRVVRKGLRAGARVVREAERDEAPTFGGKLRKAIRVQGSRGSQGKIAVSAGVRAKQFKDGAFYPAFVLYGHKTRGGGRTAPNDFISRAFERSNEAAADAAGRMILDELAKNF